MWRAFILGLSWIGGLSFTLAPDPAWAQRDTLSSLQFLIGDWIAVDTPPGESGSFSFRPSVQDRVIVRINEANYAATAERSASRHEDLLVIFTENGAIRAEYFDSEGHVIRYSVQVREPNHAVFISEPNAQEPRYRLTYIRGADGVLAGSFEIAAPGSSDAFKSYLSWKARKR